MKWVLLRVIIYLDCRVIIWIRMLMVVIRMIRYNKIWFLLLSRFKICLIYWRIILLVNSLAVKIVVTTKNNSKLAYNIIILNLMIFRLLSKVCFSSISMVLLIWILIMFKLIKPNNNKMTKVWAIMIPNKVNLIRNCLFNLR